MSIEQTNQLILLILNSALMMLLSAALLGGAWLRQNMLAQQLHQIRGRYRAMMQNHETHSNDMRSREMGSREMSGEMSSSDRGSVVNVIDEVKRTSLQVALKQIRCDRQRLSHQYRWSHIGMLTLHMVLLVFSVSLLALALRSLLSFDGLISTALFLFTLGAAGLLAGAGCILVDLWQGNGSSDPVGRSRGHSMEQVSKSFAKRITQISHRWTPNKPHAELVEAGKAGR
jgi:hypothetical protein